jgi:pimeloyl-ACP methyl ester carboxylesterase
VAAPSPSASREDPTAIFSIDTSCRPGHRLSVSACAAERRWLGDALPAPHRWADHPRQGRHSWFDGLDAIVFAIPPGNQNLTGVYSFRLAINLGSNDYFAALQRTKKPMALIAGANDEHFYADRYAPLLRPAKPGLTVELVPGLDHVDMLMKPAALAALRRTLDAMPR